MEQNIAYLDTALGILWAGDIGTAALETAALHADYAKNVSVRITVGQQKSRSESHSKWLYGKDAKNLTADKKATV
ncbi:hypothetical protein BHC46_07870 [Snodgrassella alvi]|jgi:hypothetical protein|uniref:Uncharacterized protein n=1 Tax=Snodgrassella alvi TaxID=1196083 RepID=A0A2N9XFM8_9NEIS|nr:hypothetical protein [Snodgrassella alvi]PIT47132.1 hypothetical protein BHC46_07870 [Snodgrassella alvi]